MLLHLQQLLSTCTLSNEPLNFISALVSYGGDCNVVLKLILRPITLHLTLQMCICDTHTHIYMSMLTPKCPVCNMHGFSSTGYWLSHLIHLFFITFVLNELQKVYFFGITWKKKMSSSSVWDYLAKIIEITVIVWGSQTFSRWWAAGKYRWGRQPQLRDNIPIDIIYHKLH